MSASGGLVVRQHLFLLGVELDKRWLDRIGLGMSCPTNLDELSYAQTARRRSENGL